MSEVQGKLVHNEWVCGDCYNCDGRDDKSHCIAVYNKEITQVAQKLDTTTKMHDRACNDIKEYSETIESQAKEIKGLTKALEDKESNMYRLFHDFLISDSCWVTDKAGNDLPDAVIDGELKKFVLAKEQ